MTDTPRGTDAEPGLSSPGARVDALAATHPAETALIWCGRDGTSTTATWRELSIDSTRAAHLLRDRGVREGSMVVVVLPNSIEHFVVSVATWKLGGCVLPLSAALPAWERDQILEIAAPALVVGDFLAGVPSTPTIGRSEMDWSGASAEPLPDVAPTPANAVASGGSTGRPKVIVRPGARLFDSSIPPTPARSSGFRPRMRQLVAGPLYHGGPFGWAHYGVFYDHSLVVLERFDGEAWVRAVERYRVQFAFVVPAMMRRILDVPDLARRDLASMELLLHGGAPCAPWVKRRWIELIGGSRVREGYGAIEGIGNTMIDGDEWLRRPGSVGRPFEADVRILDENGVDVPSGTIGEIYMRPHGSPGESFRYIGSPPPRRTEDGFTTVGDMGWVDDDGYVYIADRRLDMIISGGANVYPAEVEAALSDHPSIRDLVVIGLPDDRWGQRVHAIIEPVGDVSSGELEAYARSRLAPYKVPKTYEFVDHLPRNEAGKIRRRALMDERIGATPTEPEQRQ